MSLVKYAEQVLRLIGHELEAQPDKGFQLLGTYSGVLVSKAFSDGKIVATHRNN